ncbi:MULTISPECIES: hypothetical protein [unclassified Luteococcus]|uniref:hypothetical protein n=1 Tax=unclassified Luteococcus TaxID=2639923 RepID=UPI00313DDBCA
MTSQQQAITDDTQPGATGTSAAPTRRRGGWPRAALIGLLAVLLAVGGFLVWDRRQHPAVDSGAEVLPEGMALYAELDVQPDLLQQAEMARFAMTLRPAREVLTLTEKGDLREELWRGLAAGTRCAGVDYTQAVKPWLGRKVALALPDEQSAPVWALQVTDEAQARDGAAKLAACGALPPDAAYRDGFLVLAPGKGQATELVDTGRDAPLSADPRFVEDRKRVGRLGLFNFWGTKQGLIELSEHPEVARRIGRQGGLVQRLGDEARAAGWRSAAGALRMIEGTPELKLVAKADQPHKTSTTEMGMASLPQDTVLAVGISDGDQVVAEHWPEAQRLLTRLGANPAPLAQRLKGTLPEDARTMLGKDFIVSFSPASGPVTSLAELPMQVSTMARSTKDADRVEALVRRSGVSSDGYQPSRRKRTVVVSQDAERSKQVLRSRKRLTSDDGFRAAYATPEQGQIGLYANLARLGPVASDIAPTWLRPWLQDLEAVGVNAHNEDANYSVAKLRVTPRR